MRSSILVVLLVSILAAPRAHAEDSVAVEADAAAYALGGYSLVVRATRASGLEFAVGTGRYRLPHLFVGGQASDAAAGWRATSEAIQVGRVGYRWGGAHRDGPALDAIAINQLWHLEATRAGGDTRYKTLGVGISAGYYVHLGPHAYVYPTASLTIESVYGGTPAVRELEFHVSRLGYAGSVHVGWEL